jgi:hypothetical protein
VAVLGPHAFDAAGMMGTHFKASSKQYYTTPCYCTIALKLLLHHDMTRAHCCSALHCTATASAAVKHNQ